MSSGPPSANDVLIRQAYEKLQSGRFEEAIDVFSASLMVDKEARALRGRGLAHIQLKQWEAAEADLTSAKELDPGNADNWIDLGISLAAQHKVYPAIGVFEALLEREPTCVRAHIELGLLHIRLGAITKGKTQLQKALTCRPTLPERRLIESFLVEQEKLDRRRYYRPDFEAFHRQNEKSPTYSGWFSKLLRLFTFKDRGGVRRKPGASDPS